MGASSLIPLFMSLALLSKTALDLTQWGEGRQERAQKAHVRGPARGRWMNQHQMKKPKQRHESDFSAHQVNLADFYREEVKHRMHPYAEHQIQSRKLFIEDSDQLAMETHNILSMDSFYADNPLLVDEMVPINEPTQINIYNMDRDISEEEIEVPDTVSKLEDQIAMESVNHHLKKISQLPLGLKADVESDLIRKLTSVQPAPIVFRGSTTMTPEILIKHKGSPTPGSWNYESNSVEPRLDPIVWNNHINQRKSIRFSTRNDDRKESKRRPIEKKLKNWIKNKKSMSTLKPKLQSILKKYASTTIDPIQLIKKYNKSLKSTTLPPNISRKYPTKYFVGKVETKKDSKKTTTSAADVYAKYTTSSSFRNKNKSDDSSDNEDTRGKNKQKFSSFGHKIVTTEKMTFKPTVPTIKKSNENITTSHDIPTPVPIIQSRGENTVDDILSNKYNIPEYQKRKSIHTTIVPVKLHKVSIAPTNMVMLDDYYNNNKDLAFHRRRLSVVREKPKGFGQSLKDIFFPNVNTRKIIKVRKPQLKSMSTTMKPIYTTLRAIQQKFPSILLDPYTRMKKNRKIMAESKLQYGSPGQTKEDTFDDFPYKFHKPIQSVESSQYINQEKLIENSRSKLAQSQSIDRQLLSPTDPELDISEVLKTYLPVFMSLGTGLGIALHTLLYTWENHIKVDMLPSLAWTGEEVTITYDSSNERDLDDIIPITIDSQDNITLGNTEGRKSPYSIQDKELSRIIINLLPEEKRKNTRNLKIKMDKFVFFRVILTYLYNSSAQFLS